MKAIVSRGPGGPATLSFEDVPTPAPKSGEVLVAVEACGVNYPDFLLIQDLYQIKAPRPFSPGSEVCGIVCALGSMVTSLSVGERVIGRCGWGGMAQFVSVLEHKCLKIDSDMPAEHAATFLFGYGTAYYALKSLAALKSGQVVIVLGAGGGIGTAAIELATCMGAQVFAATSSEEKLAMARERGAVNGLIYPANLDEGGVRELSNRIKSLVGARGADIVVDPVGGYYAEAALRVLGLAGQHLVIGFTAGVPRIPLNLVLLKSCRIVGVNWRSFNAATPRESDINSQELLTLYRKKMIKPLVSRCFPLEDGARAIAHIAERHAIGKLAVLTGREIAESRSLTSDDVTGRPAWTPR